MKYAILFLLLMLLIGCESDQKESISIFHNGQILTINDNNEQVEALAIKGDKIVGLGSYDDLVKEYQGIYNIQQIDLGGNTLMPGIYENHSHPVWGAMKDIYELNFPWYTEPTELKEKITNYIEKNKPSIVLGGAWGSQYFELNQFESPLKWLDAINSEIPIVLFDDASHNLWVNSAGLKLGNITKDTPNPKNGKIAKDANGQPNGILYENATFLVRDHIVYSEEKYRAAITYAQKQALSFGIIGLKDAAADSKSIEVFSAMDKEGAIDMFFGLCQETPSMVRDTFLKVDQFIEVAQKYKTENIDPYFIKFFLDGIPTSSRTAAMLCTYKVDEASPEHTHGMIHVSPEILANDIANLDKNGFTIKVHAAGDSSARAAINAIEFARTTNGMNSKIHELAHASYIADSDLPRMRDLNIAADFSPYLWFPSPIIDNITNTVCEEKSLHFWEINKIYSQGIHCIAGSDWPAVAMDLNPWIGLEAMVTRKNPLLAEELTFLPDQAIPLTDALRIFTINGAKSLGRDKVSGSLEVGKFADFIQLDRPILSVNPDEISDIKVQATYYKGIKR